MTVGTGTLLGDMRFKCEEPVWQVRMAVDAAELPTGLDQASGAPAQGHGSTVPVLLKGVEVLTASRMHEISTAETATST